MHLLATIGDKAEETHDNILGSTSKMRLHDWENSLVEYLDNKQPDQDPQDSHMEDVHQHHQHRMEKRKVD